MAWWSIGKLLIAIASAVSISFTFALVTSSISSRLHCDKAGASSFNPPFVNLFPVYGIEKIMECD